MGGIGKFSIAGLVAIGLVSSIGASSSSAQELTLRTGYFLPLHTQWGGFFQRFVDKSNADGKGTVQLRLVGGPEAVPAFELGNAIKGGVLEAAGIPSSFYKNLMVEGDAIILSNMSVPEMRASGGWDYLAKLHAEKVNAHLLTAFGQGMQFHIYTTKPIEKVDFKGWKLRGVPAYKAFFDSIGATSVMVAPAEVYTSLERGVVDGYGWPIIGIFDLGWEKFTKFRVDPGFYAVNVAIVVNLPKWRGMTEAQRAHFTKMAQWFEVEYPVWEKETIAADVKRQMDAGMKVVDFGPGLRKQAEDIYWQELAKASPENIAALRKLLTK